MRAAIVPEKGQGVANESILGHWAEAERSGRDTDAALKLALAKKIGKELAARFEEHMPADAVAAIESSYRSVERQGALVMGHRLYQQARSLYQRSLMAEAGPIFAQARQEFSHGKSPMEFVAAADEAAVYFYSHDYPSALKTLRQITKEGRSKRWPRLLSRVHKMNGLILLLNGDPAAASRVFHAALSAAERAGLEKSAAMIHLNLAMSYRYLGQKREAWKHFSGALTLALLIQDDSVLDAVVCEIAENYSAIGKFRAAMEFRDEAVRLTRQAGMPVRRFDALLARANLLHRLGDRPSAQKDLREAWEVLRKIVGPLHQHSMAKLLVMEREFGVDRNPEEDVGLLTAVLDLDVGVGHHLFRSRLYLARARTRRSIGDEAGYEGDLQRGLKALGLHLRRMPESELWPSLLDVPKELFDELIRVQLRTHRGSEEAFGIAELARIYALLDRIGPLESNLRSSVLQSLSVPLTAREVTESLPVGEVLVQYALLKDQLLIWVVRKEGIELLTREIRGPADKGLIARLYTHLSRRSPAHAALTDLYDLLIRPILPKLRPGERLVLVPDSSLQAVSFRALLDRSSGRYLVQDRTLAVSPSATLYIKALKRDRALAAELGPTTLAVGNPLPSQEISPSFSSLPFAETEAASVVASFPGSEMLTRERATSAALFSDAGRHEIVHLSSHAVANQEFPLFSYFILAPEDKADSGLLYTHELYGAYFERTRLVVLAGCETADSAGAFLAIGVPSVVATLWKIEDRQTAQFFQHFYEHLRQGDDTATALRNAQFAMLSSPDPKLRNPAVWGAFEYFGPLSSSIHSDTPSEQVAVSGPGGEARTGPFSR